MRRMGSCCGWRSKRFRTGSIQVNSANAWSTFSVVRRPFWLSSRFHAIRAPGRSPLGAPVQRTKGQLSRYVKHTVDRLDLTWCDVTDDPGIQEALGFLMTREIAHQKSFEKALHSIQPNFPQGKLPGVPEFTNVYYNMSDGDDAPRGLWNEGPGWEFVENPQPAVDGGDGLASVQVSEKDVEVLSAMASRTASATETDPVTGADLGAG